MSLSQGKQKFDDIFYSVSISIISSPHYAIAGSCSSWRNCKKNLVHCNKREGAIAIQRKCLIVILVMRGHFVLIFQQGHMNPSWSLGWWGVPFIGKWQSPPNDLIDLGALLLLIDPPLPPTQISLVNITWKRLGYLLTTIGMGRVRMKMPQRAHKPPINLPGKVDGESSP